MNSEQTSEVVGLTPRARSALLGKLYYAIGKQNTNFAIQHSHKEGEEVYWTKRKTFLDLDPDADQWLIEHANHRQILKNEIILDFDRPISREQYAEDPALQALIARLTKNIPDFCVYHTGSKGIHVHIYWTPLLLMERERREKFRRELCRRQAWFSGLDLQKCSDACMIALEHTPHWKTGIQKTFLYSSHSEEPIWT